MLTGLLVLARFDQPAQRTRPTSSTTSRPTTRAYSPHTPPQPGPSATDDAAIVPGLSPVAGDAASATRVWDRWVTGTARRRAEPAARGGLEARLRSLASSSSHATCAELGGPPSRILPSGLDARSEALVRVAALVAMR